MNNLNANASISKAENIITYLFENGGGNNKMEDELFKAMGFIADAKEAISNNQPEFSADVCDSVSCAMVEINRIRIIADRYSCSRFTEEDEEDEDFVMFRLIVSLATEACRRLKTAENEIFN
ncbi:hypothetical protein [Trabulsiella odontotermitis]|uniref:Uncharacterized protein n=1 Tax=Trabulsiella odontotermitis TaxID=379893 RepID=A0A0L0GZ14_9ENTR|nr:hypothetical protein [Trabulsiella odontotermitis]KNC94004.1 hypothetical protein GM31_16660 [Trabulsiella odontotermitis]